MLSASRLRQLSNALNGSTLLGLLVARAGGARFEAGPEGLVLAHGYRLRIPPAPAFTVGNVIVLREHGHLRSRPRLLAHEARHATQYAWCVGPFMLPLYLLAAGWSWLRHGNPFSANVFERRAGLHDGGYADRPHR